MPNSCHCVGNAVLNCLSSENAPRDVRSHDCFRRLRIFNLLVKIHYELFLCGRAFCSGPNILPKHCPMYFLQNTGNMAPLYYALSIYKVYCILICCIKYEVYIYIYTYTYICIYIIINRSVSHGIFFTSFCFILLQLADSISFLYRYKTSSQNRRSAHMGNNVRTHNWL